MIKLSEKSVWKSRIGCLKIERYGEKYDKKIIVVVAFMLTGFSLTAMSASAEEITDLFLQKEVTYSGVEGGKLESGNTLNLLAKKLSMAMKQHAGPLISKMNNG